MTTTDYPLPATGGEPATGNRHSDPVAAAGVNAGMRAGAPEATPATASTGRDWFDRARVVFTPPDVWAERRPELRQLWAYATRGQQAPETGPARVWARVWAHVALVVTGLAYYAAWLVERPARFAAAVVFYVVLVHTGIGGWLPWPAWLP